MATLTAEQVYAAARGAGATHNEAVTLVAIAKGESGFRQDAYAGASTGAIKDHSFGLWQINMLGTLGPGRMKDYGLSSEEQLFDPRINAKAALDILRTQGLDAWRNVTTNANFAQRRQEAANQTAGLVNDWQSVARSLNRAWDSAPTERPDSSYDYGPNRAAGGDTVAGVGPTVGQPKPGENPDGTLAANATADQVLTYIADHYGADIAGFLEIPELRDLLIRAGQNGWSADLFATHMRGTGWWRTNSESVRQFVTAKITDPAEYEAQIGRKLAEIQQDIAPLGLNLGGPEGQRRWAENAIKYGWTSEQLTAKLSSQLQHQSDRSGFTADSIPDVTADRLMQIARMEYLTPIDRQTAERWAIKGLRQGEGGDVEEQFRSFMSTLSAARFGIEATSGIAPADIMAPVRTTIAQELELNPEAIDLLDAKYRDVLQVEGKDGFRPMTATEAGQWARNQEEYKRTTNGVDRSAALVEALSKTFGKVK